MGADHTLAVVWKELALPMKYPAILKSSEACDSIVCVSVCSAKFEGLLNVWVRHWLKVSSKVISQLG